MTNNEKSDFTFMMNGTRIRISTIEHGRVKYLNIVLQVNAGYEFTWAR